MSRRYIRHPSEIPIVISVAGHEHRRYLRNVSQGGLCIQTAGCLPNRTEVVISIPLLDPPFSASGRVVWCHDQNTDSALLGLCFDDPQTAFAVRMVEQICHIESYRQRISRERDRECSSEEAAVEWIARYAPYFPH